MTPKFKEQLEEIYALSAKSKGEFNVLFDKLQKKDYAALSAVDSALKDCDIEVNDESRYAFIRRIVALKNDSIGNYLAKDPAKDDKMEKVYVNAARMHTAKFKEVQKTIEEKKLLNEYYRTLFAMYVEAGEKLNGAQPKWMRILQKSNADLMAKCGSAEAILKYLEDNSLFDLCEGERTDHCYTLLSNKGGSYKSYAYIDIIPEIEEFVAILKKYYEKLKGLSDDEFHAEKAYTHYVDVMIKAFSERDTSKTSSAFRELDRAWMGMTTPIQPTHPFEYYEDTYRAATALEFDLRIDNPSIQLADVRANVTKMYTDLMERNGHGSDDVVRKTNLSSLKETQLHLSKPIYYFGKQLEGLFSAQVIPNDTTVSKELNKKIFASIDFIYELTKSAPSLELDHKIFSKEFLDYNKDLVANRRQDWYQVYDIETVGHEFGHILFVYGDSEVVMNKTGLYKKGEEWKATTGGLTAYFRSADRSYDTDVFHVLVARVVYLMTWMKITALNPYYCEGLVHLYLLFKGGMLSFDGEKLNVKIDRPTMDKMVELYLEAYEDLAKMYLSKTDTSVFLNKFSVYENGFHLPKEPAIRKFVDYYYALYEKMGNQIHKD